MSKDCPSGQFWNGISRSCTSCQELCLEVPSMMRSVCCDSLLRCPGGLPDAAQATCSTSNANATNITSSTMNRDSLWIGLSITFTLAMAIGLSIGFVIYRQRKKKKNVTPPVEAEAGDQAVEESQGLMSASQLLQLQEDSQRLRSFRHPAPEGQPAAAGHHEDSGNVSSASASLSNAAQHPDNCLSLSPVMQPQEETPQQAKMRLTSGAIDAHDMSTLNAQAGSTMDSQARSTSSGYSQVSHHHSNMETQMKSV